MGIRGENLRLELVQLAVDLPAFFERVAGDIAALKPSFDYYANFRKYILKRYTLYFCVIPCLN